MAETKKRVGRPTLYSQKLADAICDEIGQGKSLRSITREEAMPAMSSVFKWLRENKEFSEQYEKACEERTEYQREELLDIADNGTNDWMEDNYDKGKTPGYALNGENIQRSRLRVDTRKWLMSKMKPKKYGDKMDMTSGGEPISVSIVNYKDGGKAPL